MPTNRTYILTLPAHPPPHSCPLSRRVQRAAWGDVDGQVPASFQSSGGGRVLLLTHTMTTEKTGRASTLSAEAKTSPVQDANLPSSNQIHTCSSAAPLLLATVVPGESNVLWVTASTMNHLASVGASGPPTAPSTPAPHLKPQPVT